MAGVRITGLRETIRALEKLGVSVEDLKGAIEPITNKVVEDAKALTPVLTGALRESIRGSKAKNKAVIRGGTARTKYASFVEFGSVHNTAQHMIEDAIGNNQEYAVDKLDQELQSLIRRYDLN